MKYNVALTNIQIGMIVLEDLNTLKIEYTDIEEYGKAKTVFNKMIPRLLQSAEIILDSLDEYTLSYEEAREYKWSKTFIETYSDKQEYVYTPYKKKKLWVQEDHSHDEWSEPIDYNMVKIGTDMVKVNIYAPGPESK